MHVFHFFSGLLGQYFQTLNPEPIHSIRGLTVSQWRDTVRRELVLEDESGIWELASCEGVEGERSGPWHQSGQRHCGDLWHKQETRKQGHNNVADRCQKYYDAGASFAKWRAVLKTGITEPLELAVQLNAQGLARYAIICQENGYQRNIKAPHSYSFLLSIAVHWLPMYSDVETSSDSFMTFSSYPLSYIISTTPTSTQVCFRASNTKALHIRFRKSATSLNTLL